MALKLQDWLAKLIDKELKSSAGQTSAHDEIPSESLVRRMQDGSNLRIPVNRTHSNAVQIHQVRQPQQERIIRFANGITSSAHSTTRSLLSLVMLFEIVATPYGPADEKLTLLVTECFTRGSIDPVVYGEHVPIVSNESVKEFLTLLEGEVSSSQAKSSASDGVQVDQESSPVRFTTQMVDFGTAPQAKSAKLGYKAGNDGTSKSDQSFDKKHLLLQSLQDRHAALDRSKQDTASAAAPPVGHSPRSASAMPDIPLKTQKLTCAAAVTPAGASAPAYHWSKLPYLGKDTAISPDQESAMSTREALLRPGSHIPVANIPPRRLNAFHQHVDEARSAKGSSHSIAPASPISIPAPVQHAPSSQAKSTTLSTTPQSSPMNITSADWPSSPLEQMPPDTPTRLTGDLHAHIDSHGLGTQSSAAGSDSELELVVPVPSRISAAGVFSIPKNHSSAASPLASDIMSQAASLEKPVSLVTGNAQNISTETDSAFLASSPSRAAAAPSGEGTIGESSGTVIPCTAEPKSTAAHEQPSSDRMSNRQPLSQSSGQMRSQSDKSSQHASAQSYPVTANESDKENGNMSNSSYQSAPSESNNSPPSAKRESLKRKREPFPAKVHRDAPKGVNHFGFSQESPPSQAPLDMVKAERKEFMTSLASVHATPLTTVISKEPPSSIEGPSENSEKIFAMFQRSYPVYAGDLKHFMGVCKTLYKLSRDRGFHRHLWDDYIFRHKTQYGPYLFQCAVNVEDPIPYDVFYEQEIEFPVCTGGIMNPRTLNLVLGQSPSALGSSPHSSANTRLSGTPHSLRLISEEFESPRSFSSRSLLNEPLTSTEKSEKLPARESLSVSAEPPDENPLRAEEEGAAPASVVEKHSTPINPQATPVSRQTVTTIGSQGSSKSLGKRSAEYKATRDTSAKKARRLPWPSSAEPAKFAEPKPLGKGKPVNASVRPRYSDPTPLARKVLQKQVAGNPILPNLKRIAAEASQLEAETPMTHEALEKFFNSYARISPSGAFAESKSPKKSTRSAPDVEMNLLDWSL